jgi:hypothetical protein
MQSARGITGETSRGDQIKFGGGTKSSKSDHTTRANFSAKVTNFVLSVNEKDLISELTPVSYSQKQSNEGNIQNRNLGKNDPRFEKVVTRSPYMFEQIKFATMSLERTQHGT